MDIKNNNVNLIDDRITVNSGDFIVKKSVLGGHSLTEREFNTKSMLRKYIMLNKFNGKTLEPKNVNGVKYFLAEDGTVFKYDESNFSFYRLSLNDFVWDYDQSLSSLYYDAYLRFQEFVDFEDYYPNREDLDLSSGRQR